MCSRTKRCAPRPFHPTTPRSMPSPSPACCLLSTCLEVLEAHCDSATSPLSRQAAIEALRHAADSRGRVLARAFEVLWAANAEAERFVRWTAWALDVPGRPAAPVHVLPARELEGWAA